MYRYRYALPDSLKPQKLRLANSSPSINIISGNRPNKQSHFHFLHTTFPTHYNYATPVSLRVYLTWKHKVRTHLHTAFKSAINQYNFRYPVSACIILFPIIIQEITEVRSAYSRFKKHWPTKSEHSLWVERNTPWKN